MDRYLERICALDCSKCVLMICAALSDKTMQRQFALWDVSFLLSQLQQNGVQKLRVRTLAKRAEVTFGISAGIEVSEFFSCVGCLAILMTGFYLLTSKPEVLKCTAFVLFVSCEYTCNVNNLLLIYSFQRKQLIHKPQQNSNACQKWFHWKDLHRRWLVFCCHAELHAMVLLL